MTPTTNDRLDRYHTRYRELAAQITDIGYTTPGTLTHRYTRCANPRCRCHADPPRLHGPYWQWTTKTHGKTITRRLTPDQAALYAQWIDNNRQLHNILTQMRQTAAEATQLLLHDTPPKV